MKKRTRIQAMFLVFCMMLSFCGFSASAEPAEENAEITVATVETPSGGGSDGGSAGSSSAAGGSPAGASAGGSAGSASAGGGGSSSGGESSGSASASVSSSSGSGSAGSGSTSDSGSSGSGSAGSSSTSDSDSSGNGSAGNGSESGSGSSGNESAGSGSASGGNSAPEGSADKSSAEEASAASQNTDGSNTNKGSDTGDGNVTDGDTAGGAPSSGAPAKESASNQSSEGTHASSDKAADENGQTGSTPSSGVTFEGDSGRSETSLPSHAGNDTQDTAANQSSTTDPKQSAIKASQPVAISADSSENTRSSDDKSRTDDKDQDDADGSKPDGNNENKTISKGDEKEKNQSEMEKEGLKQLKSDEEDPEQNGEEDLEQNDEENLEQNGEEDLEQNDEENPEGESLESKKMKKTALGMKNALGEEALKDESGKIDVFIEGTLKSDGVPILISEDVNPENVTITVWKIESPVEVELDGKPEEHVVFENVEKEETGENEIRVTEDSKKIEQNINYIIKIKPSQESYFKLLDGKSSYKNEQNGQTYDVARQGEKVTLQINVPLGYHLKKAYGDDGKEVELIKDADGTYFVNVPMGGGVYLNAELEKINNGGSSSSGGDSSSSDSDYYDYSWSGVAVSVVTPAPAKPSVQEDDCSFTLDCDGIYVVFKLNGGTLAGTDGPIIIPAEAGELFALLQAPVRPGFRFVRWEPCCPKITATQPGQTFTVKKTVVFVAIWEALDGKRAGTGFEEYQTSPATYNDDDNDGDDDGPDVYKTVEIREDNSEERNVNSITVTDKAKQAIGVDITASQDVDVDEGIKVTGGENGAIGVKVDASRQNVSMEVETGDGMSVTSSGPSVGIQASASGNHSLALEFEGNVAASSSGSSGSTGIQASSGSGSSASVSVEGDVTSSDGPGLVLGES